MASAYQLQKYLKATINPRKSLSQLLLFLLLSVGLVFIVIFLTGFVIIYFNNFFFKK